MTAELGEHGPGRKKRFVVLLNPNAGRAGGEDLDARLRQGLSGPEGHQVELVRAPGLVEARERVQRAVEEGVDGVVAVGGDGSYHGLLAPLRGSNVPLGLIPLGTANDLATGNGVPLTIEEACQVIRVGATRQVDLVVVNGVPFATVGGVGLAADVAGGVNRLRERWWFRLLMRLCGHHIYGLVSVVKLLGQWRIHYDLSIEVDRREYPYHLCALFVHNQARLGRSIQTAPTADNVDGIFDICLVKMASRFRLLRTFALVLRGAHLDRPEIESLSVSKLKVRSSIPFTFFADGERMGVQTECQIRVSRRALTLIVPRNLAEGVPGAISVSWAGWSGVFTSSSGELPSMGAPPLKSR